MARFGFVGPSYRSQSILADCQTCMNWYLENIESGMGRSAAALYRTPGLQKLYDLANPAGPAEAYGIGGYGIGFYGGPVSPLAAGPVRGMVTVQGRTFVVSGAEFLEILKPNAFPNATGYGQVLSDGLPVSMAGGGNQVLIASAGSAYVFDLTKNTLVPVDPSAGANLPIAMVAWADGFFLALVENKAPTPWEINQSAVLDATTWSATNFAEVSVFADNPNCIFINQRLMWVFGPRGIQPYTNDGNFPFAFDVIPGTYIENGLAAPFSVAKLDNSLFWLGSDERGNGMVWKASGFTPQRVSNHAIEYALQSYSTIADAIAYAYQENGHSFYVLSFPTADKTWVFDAAAATGQWHERGYWNEQAGIFNRHRAAFHTFNFGIHLVGDCTQGIVHQQASSILSDNGNPIRRLRRAPHISKELKYTFHHRLQVDVEVGIGTFQGNQPSTFLYVLDVLGNTWTIQVTDQGVISVTPGGAQSGKPLYLTDSASGTSWQITINSLGLLDPVPITFNSSVPVNLQAVSNTGNSLWILAVKQLVPGIAQVSATPQGIVQSGPKMTLRWSNDGAKTWSNGQARDCGATGNFRQRVLWNRLGRARDRVYEISVDAAVPWAIIDAYLDADGYEPSERLNKDLAKRA